MQSISARFCPPSPCAERRLRGGRFCALLLALVLLLTLTACSGYNAFAIAVFIPTNDEAPNLAESVEQGIALALSEINSREGIHGKAIDIHFYPCVSEREEAVKTFTRVIDSFSPVVVFAAGEPARHIAPQAEKQSIPLIGLSVENESFTAGKQWIFRNSLTYEEECRAILDTAISLQFHELIILHSGGFEEREFIAHLEKRAAQENISMRLTEQVCTPEDGGYAAIAANRYAQAILFLDTSDRLLLRLAHCRDLNYRGTILARSALFDRTLHGMYPAVNVYSSALVIYKRHFGSAKRVFDIFQVQYGKEMCITSAFAYDTLIMLSKILHSGRINREAVRSALEAEFVYPSSFGIRFSRAGERDFVPRLYPVLLAPDGSVEYLEGELDDD